MRLASIVVVVLVASCLASLTSRRRDVDVRPSPDPQTTHPRDARLVDVGTQPLLRRCPLVGFAFGPPSRTMFADACGGLFLSYDVGVSVVPLDSTALPPGLEDLREKVSIDPADDVMLTSEFVLAIRGDFLGLRHPSGPERLRPIRRTGGGPWEPLRATVSIASEGLCTGAPICKSTDMRFGWTDHAIALSSDAGATWQVTARATWGPITDVRLVNRRFLALIEDRVYQRVAGELIESDQPTLDRFDMLGDPAPRPLSCLDSATAGQLRLVTSESGCFGGPYHALTIRWTVATSSLETRTGKRHLPRAARRTILTDLEAILTRKDPLATYDPQHTGARIDWTCDGVSEHATLHAPGTTASHAGSSRRAIALAELAAKLDP